MQIHIQKDTAQDFEDASQPFKHKDKSKGKLSLIMVALFLERFGLTPEIREQARKEIKYIEERLGLK